MTGEKRDEIESTLACMATHISNLENFVEFISDKDEEELQELECRLTFLVHKVTMDNLRQ
jgi:hypothetical protein